MRYLKPVTSLVCLSYLLSEMRLVRATTSAKLSDSTDSYQNVPRNTHRADPEATPGFLHMFPVHLYVQMALVLLMTRKWDITQ